MPREVAAVALGMAAVIVLTLVAVVSLRAAEQAEDQQRIERAATDVARTIETELGRVADLAQDIAVATSLIDDLHAASYARLLDDMAIIHRFPALTGVSYVEQVARDEVAVRLTEREQGGPRLSLREDAGEPMIRLLSLSYPADPNEAALGVDLGARPESRVAHDTALSRNAPVLSNLTRIVQLPPDEPGVSLHTPVPGEADTAATVGLVLSVPGLLQGLEPLPADVEVGVRDPGSVVFEAPVLLAAGSQPEALYSTSEVAVPGQTWEVTVTAVDGFLQPPLQRGSTLLAIGGAVSALLVGLLVYSLASRERHASDLVTLRTAEVSAANRELAAANAQLAAAGRSKDDFLAAVSHELRTPLTVIRGFVESMTRLEPRAQELAQMLPPIARNVQRLDSLVGDLLTLVSLDAGALVSHRERVEVAAFLARAPRELAGLEDDRVHIEVEGDPVASVDPQHLERIVVNLLVNADRHGAPPIVVTARTRAGMVELETRDHGPGIPGEDAELVFERFARANGQQAVTGTGLGLAIVRELAVLGGGEVGYDDAEPGARFTVRLPAAGADTDTTPDTTPDQEIGPQP